MEHAERKTGRQRKNEQQRETDGVVDRGKKRHRDKYKKAVGEEMEKTGNMNKFIYNIFVSTLFIFHSKYEAMKGST
jgi:hypothetical protein